MLKKNNTEPKDVGRVWLTKKFKRDIRLFNMEPQFKIVHHVVKCLNSVVDVSLCKTALLNYISKTKINQ